MHYAGGYAGSTSAYSSMYHASQANSIAYDMTTVSIDYEDYTDAYETRSVTLTNNSTAESNQVLSQMKNNHPHLIPTTEVRARSEFL